MTGYIISSSVLILAVIALRFFFHGKISRRLQYALWGLVLLRLLMPFPLPGSPFSIMNAVPDSSFGNSQVYVLPVGRSSVDEAYGVSVDSNGNLSDYNSMGYAVLSKDGKTVTRYAGKSSISKIFKTIWLFGGIATGLWFAGVNLSLSGKLRKTRTVHNLSGCKLPVYIAGNLASPCLFGLIHPAIYLTPKAAEKEETTRYVLAHELYHYHHGDHVWSNLRWLCLAIWWWNPLVWAAAFLSRADSELACDEAVIRALSDTNRLDYGRTLINMIAVKRTPGSLLSAATTMVSGKRGIRNRLNMIIKNPKAVISAVAAVLLITAICIGCTFTGASSEKQDLSMLNIENLAAATYQRDELLVSRAPGSEEGFNISAHMIAAYLDNADWTQKEMDSPLELSADIQIEWDEDQELRFYESEPCLAMVRMNEQFQYYTIGKDDYDGILSLVSSASELSPITVAEEADNTTIELFRNGESVYARSLSGDSAQIANTVITSYMLTSAAWPSVDINTVDEYYLLHSNDTYYIFMLDDIPVIQSEEYGRYSRLNDELYEKLIKSVANAGEPGITTGEPQNISPDYDHTDLDASIANAILEATTSTQDDFDLAAEAHTVLKTVEEDNTTTVYAMALNMQFGYAGSGFFETGGSHMPVAITFEKNADGEYTLVEYWMPTDGSGYAPSIKEKFPADIYEDALDTQKYIVAHIQSCYEQAIEYGNVNTDYEISKLIETVTSSPGPMSDPQAYIDEHAIEYRELLYYGRHTLKYCFTLFEQGGQTGLTGQIMASACRDILGDENIPILYSTGQSWYDSFKSYTVDQRSQHGDKYVKANLPGCWLLLQVSGEAKNE